MRGLPGYVGPFTGGLNTRDAVMDLPLENTPDCMNVIAGPDGSFRKRNPHILEQSANLSPAGANDITSLFWSQKLLNLLAVGGTKFFQMSPPGGAANDFTGGAAISGTRYWSFVDAPVSGGQGPVYMLPNDTGTTVPKYFPGAGNIADWTASAGTLDRGDFMLYFKNRVIMFGGLVGTNGCGVKASKVGDPRAWDTTVVGSSEAWLTNIDPNDGDGITGMGTVGPYLIVFKRTKTYLIYDLDTGANRTISTSVGCGGKHTVVNTPYGLVFMSDDSHVYVTDGTKISKLSDAVSPPKASGYFYNKLTLGQPAVNRDQQNTQTAPNAMYFQDRYYLSVADVTTGVKTTWIYDFTTKAWWRTSVGFHRMVVGWLANGGAIYGALRSVSANTPKIYKMFVPDRSPINNTWLDDGTQFTAYYTTPPLAPQGKGRNPNVRRRFHALRAWIAGDVDIQTSMDPIGLTAPAFTTQQSVNGSDVDYPQLVTVYSLGVANTMSVRFTSTDNNTFEVHPFFLYTQQRTE